MTYPVNMNITPDVQAFFDDATNTISYIVKDPTSDACAIIDSVMDIDYAAGRITFDHADELIRQIETRGLTLEWIIETHVHADHLSAAPYIQQKLGGKIGVGHKITDCTQKRSTSRLDNTPNEKATVLPLPVLALARTSLPAKTNGKLCACTGVI